ncbi:MAG: hypothetical protein ACK58T_36005 [Phycisphaerae bacterium]|jgi:protocatechuate 3,4-dioxygenase beta subunit
MITFARNCLSLLVLSAVALAQDCTATLTFNNTPNGPVSVEVTLNNSDGQNSGFGTVTRFNGSKVNFTVAYVRDANNEVSIIRDGILLGSMDYRVNARSGSATLNDGGGNSGAGSSGGGTR